MDRETRIWLLKLAEISLRKNAQNGKFYAKFGKSSNEGNAMDQAFPAEDDLFAEVWTVERPLDAVGDQIQVAVVRDCFIEMTERG